MPEARRRERVTVTGIVQGVGFRPYVYVMARRHGLAGWVVNDSRGVVIEVEGDDAAVARFLKALTTELPPLARVDALLTETVPTRGGTDFVIGDSTPGGGRTLVSPDIATCSDCLTEQADPGDRHYRHPFVSCTNCGPRYTIIVDLPYDRSATTMAPLPLCATCATEYADPRDRRFHAQTVACPACGPTLALSRLGEPSLTGPAALSGCRRLLADGAIVAIKGIGGYHLACDATDQTAVSTLRKRKNRGDKPFAIMVPDLRGAEEVAVLGRAEGALLTDPRRPAVLLARRPDPARMLAEDVAPDAPDLGVMLPYSGLHRLLFGLPGDPPGPAVLVLTSGNLAGEPIVTDDRDAVARLATLADAWLSHDRRIQVPCDDSVLRIVDGHQLPVRRSRGYAPLPVDLPFPVPATLAVGGDLKNTFCLGEGRCAWLSGHIGDMDDLATQQAFGVAQRHLQHVTGVRPRVVAADRHPGYHSTRWARTNAGTRPLISVQHHHAHLASVMAENRHPEGAPVIGVAFDGTGYGDDGAVWGGEFMITDYRRYERVGHLRYVPLPGADAGVRNPCRMALSHLRSAAVHWDPRLPCVRACSTEEVRMLDHQLRTGLQTVPTSSMGRLFDALSSLSGICHRSAYEAEAAMRFEGAARTVLSGERDAYPFPVLDGRALVADPRPLVRAAAAAVLAGTAAAEVAARFHRAVAWMVVDVADRLRERTGIETVALSGGVFLNVLLTRLCRQRLRDHGFHVLMHRQVPPSDAGLALGQLVVAGANTTGGSASCV